MELGELVSSLVRQDPRFEIIATPRFGLTCFKLKVSHPNDSLSMLTVMAHSSW